MLMLNVDLEKEEDQRKTESIYTCGEFLGQGLISNFRSPETRGSPDEGKRLSYSY